MPHRYPVSTRFISPQRSFNTDLQSSIYTLEKKREIHRKKVSWLKFLLEISAKIGMFEAVLENNKTIEQCNNRNLCWVFGSLVCKANEHIINSGRSRISHRGHGPHRGAVDPRGSYVSKILHVKMKESQPVGGHAPGVPPRSANDKRQVNSYLSVDTVQMEHMETNPPPHPYYTPIPATPIPTTTTHPNNLGWMK